MKIMLCVCHTGDDDEEEEEEGEGDGEEKMPTCGDYIMHFLTLIWKVMFAFIPPAGKAHVSQRPLFTHCCCS